MLMALILNGNSKNVHTCEKMLKKYFRFVAAFDLNKCLKQTRSPYSHLFLSYHLIQRPCIYSYRLFRILYSFCLRIQKCRGFFYQIIFLLIVLETIARNNCIKDTNSTLGDTFKFIRSVLYIAIC